MTLIIADPDVSDPIITYPNGVKVIRLHEYVGPARGTLSVVSDPLSICGQVVSDSQQVSYTGTDPNKTISSQLTAVGLDTIRIHKDDLAISSDFRYRFYMSVRCEGTIDITKQNSNHTFLDIGSNAASAAIYTSNAAFSIYSSQAGAISPKPQVNPYYKIRDCGGAISLGSFTEGYEWLVIKAGSGVGGSFVWYLDTLWMVPIDANTYPSPGLYVFSDFRQLLQDTNFEPVFDLKTSTYDESRDDVSEDWIGQYSVMRLAPSGYLSADSCMADFQVNENEKTMYNVFGTFSTEDWILDPASDLTFIVGSHYTPSHQIDEDQFNRIVARDLNPYLGASAENRAWRVLNNHPFQAAANSGFLIDGTKLIFQNGKYDLSFPQFFPDPPSSVSGSTGDFAGVQLGAFGTESGAGAGSLGHQVFSGMNHCIMECAVTTNHILVAGFHMFAGFGTANSDFIGVCLDIPSADVFGLRTSSSINAVLMYYPTYGCEREVTTIVHETHLDEFVLTTGFTANTWIRIKVEMMWYRYRAKVWLDGDPEPADWQLEAFMPMPPNAPGGHPDAYFYPWDTQSTIGATRRTANSLFPTFGVRYFRPYETTSGGQNPDSSNIRLTDTYWKDLTLNYEAYGSTPKDIHARLKKYDDSIDYGEVTIPYQCSRLIIAPLNQYTFSGDDDGFSVTLWKESGSPDTQAAVIADLWQKMRRGQDIGVYELVPLK